MAKSKGELDKQRIKAITKAKLETERSRLTQEMNSQLKKQSEQLKVAIFLLYS